MLSLIIAIMSFLISITMFILYGPLNHLLYLILGFVFLIISLAISSFFIYLRLRRQLQQANSQLEAWSNTTYHVSNAGDEAINNLPVGILVYEDGHIKWANDYLKNIFKSRLLDEELLEVIPDLKDVLNTKVKNYKLEIDGNYYDVLIRREEQVLYFFDITELEKLRHKYDSRTKALAIVVIDNLEQALKNFGLSEQATYRGELLQEISDYFRIRGGYLQSYEDDRMLVVLDKEDVKEMIEDNFSILDKIRAISSKNRTRVTVSIGIACYDADAQEVAKNAQSAIDMAEKRGGDQVVVNIQGEKVQFFGGKTNAVEDATLREARVKANELKDLVQASTNVYITGHIGADADCFGAMLATLKMCLSSGKEAYIVFEENKADQNIIRLVQSIKEMAPQTYKRIIPLSEVDVKTNSLLVVCDTQSPRIMMFKELYDMFKPIEIGNQMVKNIAVIDHHRVGEVGFDNIALSYIATYASSTVELVTEMLLFYGDNIKMEPIEATCMLVGLIIDTNNFTFRTTSRTFEAASIIRSFDADMILVKTISRSPFEMEKEIAEAVINADIVLGRYAIAVLPDNQIHSDRSFLAQIADKLMAIDGIDASFAIGRLEENLVGVSARSYEKINVQVLMEQMNGGGHLTNAATQVKEKTVSDVKKQLVEILKINNENEDDEKMKVILLEDIKGRGKKDAIIDVANGYGNYLLTNNLAILATDENIAKVNEQIAKAKEEEEKHYNLMKQIKSDIESKDITVYIKVGADGKAFGHITTKLICEEFEAQTGIKIDKRKVTLPLEINSVGIFTATVDLYKDIKASITIKVEEQ